MALDQNGWGRALGLQGCKQNLEGLGFRVEVYKDECILRAEATNQVHVYGLSVLCRRVH